MGTEAKRKKAENRQSVRYSKERVAVKIYDDPKEIAREVAGRVANIITSNNASEKNTVLGLPTGSTPIGVYHELIRLHREQGLDFSNVVTFNLDEYYPMEPNSLQSYNRFMFENFFEHVNIDAANIHIPDGSIPRDDVDDHCIAYEEKIQQAGGIDLMLLGIGRSGHIGFNEPGSSPEDRTRLIVLDEITRRDAASDFFEEKYVPREAITMGVGTIMEAREIILMATGEHKAPIVRRAVEDPRNNSVTATYLQDHQAATFYLDRAAASDLTREKTPWLVGAVEWNFDLATRAVIWLSEQENKAIPHLETADFQRHHLHDLTHSYEDVDELCLQVFENLRRKILYADQLPKGKRIIVFSPHPDDDVISMGGMLGKLVSNDNEVTVAYMTNGSVAVFDQDVTRHLRFVEMSYSVLAGSQPHESFVQRSDEIQELLDKKKPGEIDSESVQKIKAFIRYTEAIAAIEVMGLSEKSARFLDLPFYKTGRVKKDPVGEGDVSIILNLFRELDPQEIFVAGDLSDPHGTHRMCYAAIEQAFVRYIGGAKWTKVIDDHVSDIDRPRVWLYRGAWQEWEIDRADVFVPLTKAELDRKIEAIFKHESQKDRALFPGAYDSREFWQRARDRNLETAARLDALGLPEFYAAEAFVTCFEMP